MHRVLGIRSYSHLLPPLPVSVPVTVSVCRTSPSVTALPEPLYLRHTYFCNYCRNTTKGHLVSDKSIHTITGREQSTQAILAVKNKKKKRKPRKYVELLEVSEDTTNQTKASISQLRPADLSKLIKNPEISLQRLHELKSTKKKTKSKTESKIIDVQLLRDIENTILNKYKKEIKFTEDDFAIIFTTESIIDTKHLQDKNKIKFMKDSYDKFRRETVRVQKMNDLEHAINDGVSQSIVPEESPEKSSESPKSPHIIFKECLEEFKNKPNVDIPALKISKTKKIQSESSINKKSSTTEKSKLGSKDYLLHNDFLESQKKAKEESLSRLLTAHFEVCVTSGMVDKTYQILKFYLQRSKKANNVSLKNTAIFNTVIQGYASTGNYDKVCDVLKLMEEYSVVYSTETFSAIFECIDKANLLDKQSVLNKYQLLMQSMNIGLNDLVNKSHYTKDQKSSILNSIRLLQPDFVISYPDLKLDYNCPLLMHLNEENPIKVSSAAKDLFTFDELKSKIDIQKNNEVKGFIELNNIDVSDEPTEHTLYCRQTLETLESKWKEAVHNTFLHNLGTLKAQSQVSDITIHIHPYLNVLPPEEYVNIILAEIKNLAMGSETYSPTTGVLQIKLGEKVFTRFEMLKKQQNGEVADILKMYEEYCDWYLNRPESEKFKNPRRKWQEILRTNADEACIDSMRNKWPSSTCQGVGKFLYNILINSVQVDVNSLKKTIKSKKYMPAFYNVFRNYGYIIKQEIKPHPVLAKLFKDSMPVKLTMDANLVPSFSPPIPWVNEVHGGYLVTKTPIMRVISGSILQMDRLKNAPPKSLYPVLDSLNQLGAVPWKINRPVLDLMIKIFREGGSKEFTIAQPPQAISMPIPASASLSKKERAATMRKRAIVSRVRQEMYSLWCDLLYKLSLANHFRDEIFWLPHNMDFRGRVYPCPPHLSHLGADTARSLLVFAKGEKLGPNGLQWLKLHCINLTGTMKRNTVDERLIHVESIMDDILDSADNPLGGKKWWVQSETPWQTLACCMEIANAIRSPNHEEYVCHFPVHQDGSCNGLQHYAALGGDTAGAHSVNLSSDAKPQDVYSSVVALVEESRARDAAEGVTIAQQLEGFIKRKVIKQTVMTTVYGVTRYGARLQIAKQLRDVEEFPKSSVWAASSYLTVKTFESLAQMFTSTREIQDWFVDCARGISGVCKDKVEWVTPLGLPIIQPYHKNFSKMKAPLTNGKIVESSPCDLYEKPCLVKQKNAFPPNFIHSLDSSHMMLTSIHCEAEDITFVSVHDCFWTHPSSVEIMNKICREQFVALHSQPILENLSKFMLDRYTNPETRSFNLKMADSADLEKLTVLFKRLPKKGNFDLNEVLKSTYFFS